MTLYLRDIILFVHILLGITWLGGILFVGWGVYPVAKKLPVSQQQPFLYQMMKHIHPLFVFDGLGVIATGISLATVLGPIHSWEMITTTRYGQLFLAACLIASVSLLWGSLISYPYTMHLLKNKQIWEYANRGGEEVLLNAMRRTTLISAFEVVGLIFVVWIMVLI